MENLGTLELYRTTKSKLCVFLHAPDLYFFICTVVFVTNGVGVNHHNTYNMPHKWLGLKMS